MDNETRNYLKGVRDGYARRRAKEDWRIGEEEWIAFWSSHPMLAMKLKRPRDTVIYRLDEDHAWTIKNLGVMTRKKMCQKKGERRRRSRVEMETALAAVEPNPTLRVLTLRQWVEEIRR